MLCRIISFQLRLFYNASCWQFGTVQPTGFWSNTMKEQGLLTLLSPLTPPYSQCIHLKICIPYRPWNFRLPRHWQKGRWWLNSLHSVNVPCSSTISNNISQSSLAAPENQPPQVEFLTSSSPKLCSVFTRLISKQSFLDILQH